MKKSASGVGVIVAEEDLKPLVIGVRSLAELMSPKVPLAFPENRRKRCCICGTFLNHYNGEKICHACRKKH